MVSLWFTNGNVTQYLRRLGTGATAAVRHKLVSLFMSSLIERDIDGCLSSVELQMVSVTVRSPFITVRGFPSLTWHL